MEKDWIAGAKKWASPYGDAHLAGTVNILSLTFEPVYNVLGFFVFRILKNTYYILNLYYDI